MKLLRKILLLLIIFISPTLLLAQNSGSIEYKMASYSSTANKRDASTRLLNMAFFNKETFTVNFTNFSYGFQFVFDLIIGISIATAVVVFMLSAFQQITGKGSISQIKQGKEGMVNAIVGLMIILSTWLIINTINPDLVRLPIFQKLDSLGNTNNTQTSGGNNSSVVSGSL